MRNELREKVYAAIAYLEGTCESIDSVLTEEEQNDREVCQLLDENIFLCDNCGWWLSVDEQADNGETVCIECKNDK